MSGHRSTRKRCGDSHPESPVGFGHMSTTGHLCGLILPVLVAFSFTSLWMP
uniref:Choline/ethanolaminephosphotransferase 1 n=1 Tax=Mus musculus TaxID=10090 RepID=D6RFR8_MOUSE